MARVPGVARADELVSANFHFGIVLRFLFADHRQQLLVLSVLVGLVRVAANFSGLLKDEAAQGLRVGSQLLVSCAVPSLDEPGEVGLAVQDF